jgi:formylglycine-generating enzyme required for sulfatase activity
VWEWTVDFYADLGGPITDAADVTPSDFRVIRGGAFDYHAPNLLASFRYDFSPITRNGDQGARCARSP